LDSFDRIGTFQWVTWNLNKKSLPLDDYSRGEAESPPPPYTLGVEFPSDDIKSTDLFLYRESLDDTVID
jgi:hypothetical protein